MSTAHIGYGKVNLRTSSASFASLRVKAPFVRDSAVTTAKRAAYTQVTTPVSNFPQINGVMVSDNCEHPEGTVIMLQAMWRLGGSSLRDGCVLLRLRDDAALLNVIANLPHGPDSRIGDTFSIFRGNADILSSDEAKVLKIEIPGHFINRFFDPTQVDECFDIRELVRERSARPEVRLVSTAQGLVVSEVAAPPKRRVIIRR